MNTEHWIVYSLETGESVFRGFGEEGDTARQTVPSGMAILSVPRDVYEVGLLSAPLARVQDLFWDNIKAKRDAAINGGAPTPVGAVDSDEISRTNIIGAVTAAILSERAGAPLSMNWTMLDNSVETLDAEGVISLGLAVMQHVNSAHDRARQLRAETDAADNVAEMLAIDINSGWPS